MALRSRRELFLQVLQYRKVELPHIIKSYHHILDFCRSQSHTFYVNDVIHATCDMVVSL